MRISLSVAAQNAVVSDLVSRLQILLADTLVAKSLAQNFHWNIVGRDFKALHDLLENQYDELGSAADEIAERIRALGAVAQGTINEITVNASLPDQSVSTEVEINFAAGRMLAAYRHLSDSARQALSIATHLSDAATSDILARRILAQDKAAWMLDSTLPRNE